MSESADLSNTPAVPASVPDSATDAASSAGATSLQTCAREVLDVPPVIIQAIRFEMRSLRLTDLSVPQFRTLAYISRNPGASLSAAAEFIGLTLSSMSILVNGLVDKGMVEREVGRQDRRRIHLTLTPGGKQLLTGILEGTEQRLADMLLPLSDEERLTIVRALELLRPIFQPRALAPRLDEAVPNVAVDPAQRNAADGA
ncbi:MAG: MarR family winged helix-turn-helix transcriptional regulator [Caldilineaceae bacterium]